MRRREVRLLKRQIELPLCGRGLACLSRERFHCSIDAERLQYPQTCVPTALSARKPPNEMHRAVP